MRQPRSGPMTGRTVLVTGGTGGIGRATALGLARMGADLAISGRDRGSAEVLQRCARIDVLVNNVGGYWDTRHVTADGLERTFALNHLAPFLLTNLLLDRLAHSAPARIVTVSSTPMSRGGSTSKTSRAKGPTACSPLSPGRATKFARICVLGLRWVKYPPGGPNQSKGAGRCARRSASG